MSRMMMTTLLAFALCPAALLAQDFNNVALSDVNCSAKIKANPDTHTRSCALQCAKSGYGIFTQDGRFLKFDSNGNEEVTQILQKSNKNDHLRVDVDGTVSGDTLQVKSIRML